MPSPLSGSIQRVLMTADAVGGVWTYALDLSRALAVGGVATTLVLLGPRASPAQRREAEEIPHLTLIETRLPLDWLCDDPIALREAAAAVAALAVETDAEIVQLNGCALAGEAEFALPVVTVHHSCVATWWAATKKGPLPRKWRWRFDLVRRHLASATRVVAPSAAFGAQIVTTYSLPNPPRVIYNGRSRAPAKSQGRPLRAVFTAGRLWDEGKNIAALDRAAASLDAPVFAAGPLSGPDGAQIAGDHLLFQGELTSGEVRNWLAKRPIFVSCAIYEPFGLAVLEAAQAGCALVLSDIPTFLELWDGAALFAPARDAEAFAEAARALLRDPARRRRMGCAARERARLYSLEASAQRLMALYHEAIGRPLEFSVDSAA